MKIPKIKMLILDVDGTMTDNGVYIDENGIESKRYNAKDGVGIYELLKNDMIIGIISHSEKGNGIISRANYLGIQYCHVGDDPKDKILNKWVAIENINLNDVAFIGDDINDISLINIVGFSACPKDASQPVKDKATLILNSIGGYGCVREFSDLYLSQNS